MQKLKRKINNLLFGRYKHSLSNSKSTSVRSLDRLNLSLGDVRDVFEPYLAIFLAAARHWNPAQVGIALSTTSIAGILAQTPTGALVDASRHKRLMIATATLAVAISYMVIVNFSALPAVVAAQAVIGISAVIVGPVNDDSRSWLGRNGRQPLGQKTIATNCFCCCFSSDWALYYKPQPLVFSFSTSFRRHCIGYFYSTSCNYCCRFNPRNRAI